MWRLASRKRGEGARAEGDLATASPHQRSLKTGARASLSLPGADLQRFKCSIHSDIVPQPRNDGAGLRDRQRFGDPMAHLVKKKAPVAHEKDGETFYQDRFGVSLEELRRVGLSSRQRPLHSWLKRRVGAQRIGLNQVRARPAPPKMNPTLSLSDVWLTASAPPVVSRPGAHWDDVDRSNSLRGTLRSEQEGAGQMAFMWSREDM